MPDDGEEEEERKQVVYLVRHAEATHNVKEREAMQAAQARGISHQCSLARERRAVLEHDRSLFDAALSSHGRSQVRAASERLQELNGSCEQDYPPPHLILVSPLRRTLMTATEMFLHDDDDDDDNHDGNDNNDNDDANDGNDNSDHSTGTPPRRSPPCRRPRFLAIEALREKRTGFAADERSSVEVLQLEFPHVDFSDVRRVQALVEDNDHERIAIGEENKQVQERGRRLLEERLYDLTHHTTTVRPKKKDTDDHDDEDDDDDTIAIVTHKGWLRELRHTIKDFIEEGRVTAEFDFEDWDETLFQNAEVRVAQFGWTKKKLTTLISKSIENASTSACSNCPLPNNKNSNNINNNNKNKVTTIETVTET